MLISLLDVFLLIEVVGGLSGRRAAVCTTAGGAEITGMVALTCGPRMA